MDAARASIWRGAGGGVKLAVLLLALMVAACFAAVPWLLSGQPPRFNAGESREARLPPSWSPLDDETRMRCEAIAKQTGGVSPLSRAPVFFLLGSDLLGRSLLYRCLLGGAVSLGVGVLAALVSVVIGTLYGAAAASAGGRLDAVMMRIVDILYSLPSVLLIVLLAVASDAIVQRMGGLGPAGRQVVSLLTLLVAIGGVSWLTTARVIRGQVLSLVNQPFVESARAIGAGWGRIFVRHLLPNLVGPIVVYATLAVPQAILQESFLSFLGIGVKPPVPSWGNLAADGLAELNPYRSHWWLLLFPCVLLAGTLLSLSLIGEWLRARLDPKSRERRS
ncbi:MAG: ABC transporter permease [Phycisphaerae bacterium]|nr:ABC transporter permease [Phycisphaerae bacterium]